MRRFYRWITRPFRRFWYWLFPLPPLDLDAVATIGTAILGVAVLAVLVSKESQTKEVIESAGKGFKDILKAAGEE